MQSHSCEQAKGWISLKVDGELRLPATRSALEAHLAQCEACTELLNAESRQSNLLKAELLPREAEASALKLSILRAMAELDRVSPDGGDFFERGSWRFLPWRRWGAAAALLVVGSWTGWNLWPSREAAQSLHVELEETVEDSQLVPDSDGRPIRREFERVRRWIVPTSSTGSPSGSDEDPSLRYERVNTRNVKLVNWPYR